VSEQPPIGSPYPQQPPPSGMSNTSKFWIGAVLALPVVVIGSILIGIASGIGSAFDDTGTASAILGGLASVLELAAVVVALVLPRTRWFALGAIAGIAVLAVVAAGACVVLIAAYSNSF
jgi:hypothetical protein